MARFAPHKRGTLNHNAKLDRAKVLYIRASTRSNQALARELGVSKAAISNVRTGRTWSWLTSDADRADAADAARDRGVVARVAATQVPPSPDADASSSAAAPAPLGASRGSLVAAPTSAPGAPPDATTSAPAVVPGLRLAADAAAPASAPRRATTSAPAIAPGLRLAADTAAPAGPATTSRIHVSASAPGMATDTSAGGVAGPRELTTTKAASLRARVIGHVSARDTGTRAANSLTPAPASGSQIDAAVTDKHVPIDRIRSDDERRVAGGSLGA